MDWFRRLVRRVLAPGRAPSNRASAGRLPGPFRRVRLGTEGLGDRVVPAVGTPFELFAGLRPLAGPSAVAFGPDGHLYVASHGNQAILRYRGTDGHLLPAPGRTGATFVPHVLAGSAAAPAEMTFGPDGHLYVTSFGLNKVLCFDGTTGDLRGAVGGPELGRPNGLAVGPDGDLYVSSDTTGGVFRYDGTTGAYLGPAVAGGPDGPLERVGDLAFGPDGALYVASGGTNSVLRFDAATGAYLGDFARGAGLRNPHGLAFGPDGSLYVGSYATGRVLRCRPVGDGTATVEVFAGRGVGRPHGLTFGPDGSLYVAGLGTRHVRRFATPDGTDLGAFDQDVTRTNIYLNHLDVTRYEYNGSAYTDPYYSPLRLGLPLAGIDRVYTYDFQRLAQVRNFLVGVRRGPVLRAIFDAVTAGATSNTDKHLTVLAFLQRASNHSPVLQPIDPDGKVVVDPLVLLELSEMRCGHVARVAVGLYSAAGYPARVVQLGAHVIAEVHYDGGWHYLDADLFGGGGVVRNPDGTIPSVARLSHTPDLIDAVPALWEPDYRNAIPTASLRYPSFHYFSRRAYAGYSPWYWPPGHVSPAVPFAPAADIRLRPLAPHYVPSAPVLGQMTTARRPDGSAQVTLTWAASADGDADLLGYRVFVSRQSRGWNYAGDSTSAALLPRKSGTGAWDPSLYDARFTPPGSEVVLLTTATPSVSFVLPAAGDYYVTVMPFDSHGEAAGRTLYPLSEEIRISDGA